MKVGGSAVKVTPKKINIKQGTDKLNKTEATTNIEPKEEKVRFKFFKIVWLIIKGKNENTGFTSGIFASFLSAGFNAMAVIGGISIVVAIVYGINYIFLMDWSAVNIIGNILHIFTCIAILFICFIMSVMLRGAANEIEKEEDRNFVIAVFSGVVSFAALIIALVT